MNRETLQAEATFAMPRPHAGPRPDVTSQYRELRTAAMSLRTQIAEARTA
ncbi:hypothetical protein RTCIAT899_PC08280 (plasmid) [Rhizobium tropici CIAT 899]|nr:hypothetical protein RTCIAT899_PC08280 [Rhizobium tropici CIAT 899]